MKKIISICLLFILISSFTVMINFPADREIKNFILKATDNKNFSLTKYKNARGFIVVFTCNKCPMAKMYSERLNTLYAKFKQKGVYLVAINSMDTLAYKEESFALMQKKVKTEKLDFPYLQDKSQKVAKMFAATHTPQAFVISKDLLGRWMVRYQGCIDDSALDPTKANNYLEKAVDEILIYKFASNPYTTSVGCRIFYRGEKPKMD